MLNFLPPSQSPDEQRHRCKKVIMLITNLIGILLLIYLIRRIGIKPISDSIGHLGFWFWPICLLAVGWYFLQAVAWRMIQRHFSRHISLPFFFRIKIISDAFNTLLPTVNLGGDMARAYLINREIPLTEGIPGVMVDKTVEFISGLVFMAIGLLLSLFFIAIPRSLVWPSIVCLILSFLAIVITLFFQIKGFYKILSKIGRLFPWAKRFLQDKEKQFKTLDANLSRLYRQARGLLLIVMGLYILGRVLGVIEVMVILWVLGHPVGFIGAVFISSLVMIVNTIFFIIPGEWGVAEGAHILAIQSLGIPGTIGLSLGITKRVRAIFFCVIGILLLNFERKKRQPLNRVDSFS
jgi:putative membrane protein